MDYFENLVKSWALIPIKFKDTYNIKVDASLSSFDRSPEVHSWASG